MSFQYINMNAATGQVQIILGQGLYPPQQQQWLLWPPAGWQLRVVGPPPQPQQMLWPTFAIDYSYQQYGQQLGHYGLSPHNQWMQQQDWPQPLDERPTSLASRSASRRIRPRNEVASDETVVCREPLQQHQSTRNVVPQPPKETRTLQKSSSAAAAVRQDVQINCVKNISASSVALQTKNEIGPVVNQTSGVRIISTFSQQQVVEPLKIEYKEAQ